MTALAKPLKIEFIGTHEIRLFAPLPREQLSSVAIIDIYNALDLKHSARRAFAKVLREDRWKVYTKAVATQDGILLLVAYFIGWALVNAHEDNQARIYGYDLKDEHGGEISSPLLEDYLSETLSAYVQRAWERTHTETNVGGRV